MFLRRRAILLIALGALLVVVLGWAGSQPVLAQNSANDGCLACHGQPGMQATLPSGEVVYLTVDAGVYNASVHGQEGNACIECHPDVDLQAHPKGDSAWQDLGVRTHRDLSILLYRDACVECHEDQYADNLDGAHQKAIAAGDENAAICTDCHGTHNITDPTQPLSKGSQMCERCHSEIYELYKESVHGGALLGEGNADVPSCTDCHSVHKTQGPLGDTASSSFHLASPELCRTCHSDAVLMGKYGLNADVYDTYVADFHGTTVALFEKLAPGQETNKPVCIDCHGVHDMRMVDDPESTVIKENLLVTCQKCHPDATANFPTSWIGHYRPDAKHTPLVFFVNLFYWILIPAVLGLMIVLVAIDARKRIASRGRRSTNMPSHTRYKRFSISDRVEHWLLFASFTLLAVTGLVQQHVDWGVYGAIIRFFGGIENTRLIHHISAIVLMFETIYHLGIQGYRFFVLGTKPSILPAKEDAVNIWQFLKHGLGLSSKRAQEGHFSFAEKLEYWAVIWGTVVMGITGFMLWNPILTTRLLSGSFVPAAKAAHGKEALLAVLAILIWHLYTVHIRHLNLSMFHGKMTEEEMEDEHPRALADIKAGKVDVRPDPTTVRRRKMIFLPVFAVLAAAMMVGVYFFVASETTAVATAPAAEDVAIYAPYTATPLPTLAPTPTPVPPTPTPSPVPGETPLPQAPDTWQSGIGELMQEKCGACHSSANPLGGLDLSSYQAALTGGKTGPGIVPGEPNTSLVISRQKSGKHPGMFTAEELQRVLAWIEAGAPEK